jgi:hypothetical protein
MFSPGFYKTDHRKLKLRELVLVWVVASADDLCGYTKSASDRGLLDAVALG